MRFKKLTLILSSTIVLAACNGVTADNQETTPETQSNKSEEMVPNPRILGNALKTSAKSLKTGSTDPEFLDVNKGVRIGYGYDPVTRKVLSIPMNSEDFAYTLGTKDKSPFEIPSACVMVNYADELGKVLSSSNATLLNADIKGAVNVGLAKAGVAASFNRETLDDNSSLSVSKLFGASVKCQVDTNVAPDIVADKSDNYQYMQEALMKAAPGLSTSIAEIRTSKTIAARQAAIKSFYEKYGTYMVSGVTLGQVAVRKIDMTQQMSTSETKTAGAAAANYSSPFSSVEASAKYAAADKVDAKSWKISIKEGFFPANNQLNDVISRLQAEFNTMKTGGIIEFDKLKPNPVDKPDIATPTIPTIEVDKELKATYAKANTSYKTIVTLVADIQSTLADIGTNKDEKILHYTQLSEDISNVVELNTELNAESTLSYLSTTNYDNYVSKYGTLIGKWRSNKLAASCTQMVTALEGDNQTTIASLETKIRAAISDANTAQGKEKTAADEQKQKDDQASKDKTKEGVTLSKYIETKFIKKYHDSKTLEDLEMSENYDKAKTPGEKEIVFRRWITLKVNGDEVTRKDYFASASSWNDEWKQKYGSEPAVPLYVPKAEADKYLQQNSLLKTTLQTGNDEDLYKDKGVLDFKVTAWAKIFPELTQTFGIDDSAEFNESILSDAVKSYIKYYLYLSQMSALDGSLENLRYQEESIYKKLNKFQVDLNYALDNSQSKVVFLGTTYDMDQEGDVNSLIQKINEVKSTSPMLKSEWYKATKELFSRGLIGEFGSFLGAQPVYPNKMNTFVLLVNAFNRLPTLSEMNAKDTSNVYNSSGVRIFLQKIANQFSKGNELSGIFETVRTTKNLDLNNSEYKNNYMFDSYHDVGRLALNDVQQNTPTNLTGIMPAVLGSTKFDKGIISNLGIVDSSGHILGANAGLTNIGDSYNITTLTYNLDLNQSIGNSQNPAYTLSINSPHGVLDYITEVKVRGLKNDANTEYNKLLLGASIMPLLVCHTGLYTTTLPGVGGWNPIAGKSDNPINSSCIRYLAYYHLSPDLMFKRSVVSSSNLNTSDGYSLSVSPGGAYLNNADKVFSYMNNYRTNFNFGPNRSDNKFNYDQTAIDNNWFDINFPNNWGQVATPQSPSYGYNLVITPINREVISSMSNILKVGGNRQSPFLPTYYYWNL